MTALHPDAELAPRDIVARGVYAESRAGRRPALDCRGLGARIHLDFPTVAAACAQAGIDLARRSRMTLAQALAPRPSRSLHDPALARPDPGTLVRAALIEDLGSHGDITTRTVIPPTPPQAPRSARVTRARHRECGLPLWPFA